MATVRPHLSIHNGDGLSTYFKSVKRPWRLASAELPDEDVSIGHGIKIGAPKKLLRSFTKSLRFYQAAWMWMRPDPPTFGIADLNRIQAKAGLDHLSETEFALGLRDDCREMMRIHDRLIDWGECRLALLELKLHPPQIITDDLNDQAVQLRYGLAEASTLQWSGHLDIAKQACHKVIQRALDAAAQSVFNVLGKKKPDEKCHVRANLMVPVTSSNPDGPRWVVDSVTQENDRRSRELWKGENSSEYLIVLAETAINQHVGFWVPLAHHADHSIPGAPTAYDKLHGCAVFKEDLPPLKGFEPETEARWHKYLRENLREQLFVSLPFLVRTDIGGPSHAIAVLNVNADPPLDCGWQRAHHKEWLAFAERAASPFMEIAFQGLQLLMSVDPGIGTAKLCAGIDRWNKMPGLGANLYLPASKITHEHIAARPETGPKRITGPTGPSS